MTEPRCDEVAAAVPASVGQMRHAIAAFVRRLGADDDVVARVQLAVSEAVTNAVVHAFSELPAPGTLTVSAYAEGGDVLVLVGDDGAGMAARPDSPGLGIGLPLMTQLTQSLEFRERPGGGTEVAMRFSLAA